MLPCMILLINILPDAKDTVKLAECNVSHIVAVYDNASPVLKEYHYKCVNASDTVDQDLSPHFYDCIKFIHKARINGNGVLVHCIAGISRSSTIVAAYLIVVANVGWQDAIQAIRMCRSVANPNYGFQRQLEDFELKKAGEFRLKLMKKYKLDPADEQYIKDILEGTQQPEQPLEAKLNTETFRNYEKQRVDAGKDASKPKSK